MDEQESAVKSFPTVGDGTGLAQTDSLYKEELQLATIETARQTFIEDVVKRGLAAPRGRRRLLATCEAFLSHVERKVFPSGCFFVAFRCFAMTRAVLPYRWGNRSIPSASRGCP